MTGSNLVIFSLLPFSELRSTDCVPYRVGFLALSFAGISPSDPVIYWLIQIPECVSRRICQLNSRQVFYRFFLLASLCWIHQPSKADQVLEAASQTIICFCVRPPRDLTVQNCSRFRFDNEYGSVSQYRHAPRTWMAN